MQDNGRTTKRKNNSNTRGAQRNISIRHISQTKYPDREKAPQKIPNFFTDVKESNFGWIGNQFVAHDYDYTIIKLVDFGLTNKTKIWKPHNK